MAWCINKHVINYTFRAQLMVVYYIRCGRWREHNVGYAEKVSIACYGGFRPAFGPALVTVES